MVRCTKENLVSKRYIDHYVSKWDLVNDTAIVYYDDEYLFVYNSVSSKKILPDYINKSTDVISFNFADSSLFVLYKTGIGYAPNLVSEDMKFLKYNIHNKIVTMLTLPNLLEIADFNVSPNGNRFVFFVSHVNTKTDEGRPAWEKIVLSDLSPDWKVTIDSVNNHSGTHEFLFSAAGNVWINDSTFFYCKASKTARKIFVCKKDKKEKRFICEIGSKMNSSFTVDKRLNFFTTDSQNIYQVRSKKTIPVYAAKNVILDRFFVE